MAKGVNLKITIDTDTKMIMDVYKNENGLLVFDLYKKDSENGYSGGRIEVDPAEFSKALDSLLSE